MNSVPLGSSGTGHSPSLTHAAECLAKAATTLSEAAQAMSIAAQVLSSRASVSLSQSNRVIGPVPAVSGNGENYVNSPSMDQVLPSNPSGSFSTAPTEKNRAEELDGSYRIVADKEADVLLFVCSLIGKNQKVVCYMNCSVPAFPLYQKLINDVTEAPVHAITEITTDELERVKSDFLEEEGGALLLPDVVCPDMRLVEADSWVIHVGWPADKHRYQAQKKAHQAQNNILIVHSKDENRYPAGSAVMSQTVPWPGNDALFGIAVDVLRPLFDEGLAGIPFRFKEAVYTDWIACHGPKGHRYVRSWTASELVYHANLFLLDVLRYHGPNSQNIDSTIRVPMPEVSAEFVANNGLESAVEEGVLQVESSSSLNHISPPSNRDLAPSLNETGPTGGSNYQVTVTHSDYAPSRNPEDEALSTYSLAGSQRGSTPAPSHSERDVPTESSVPPVKFRQTLGHTYFALEEDFDAIPLICFLAGEYEKLVCFTDNQGALAGYREMFSSIIGHPVIAPVAMNDEQANEGAAVQFVEHTSSAVLLLNFGIKKMPTALIKHQIGHCVYWGFSNPLQIAKRHRSQLACSSTSLIITAAQGAALSKRSTGVEAHPSSVALLDLSSNSLLAPMRDATRSFLASNKRVVKSLHQARMYFFSHVPRTTLSAEEAARRVNQYNARVLLHGNAEDGSQTFPPIAGRPITSANTVKKFDLQPAVEAGLLVVGK